MEKYCSKEAGSFNTAHSTISESFGGLVRMGESFVDRTKKISYPIAFVALVLPQAVEADVEKDMSFEEGVIALRESVQEDQFEVAADFISTPDGGLWTYHEGEAESVSLGVEPTLQKWEELLSELDISPGESVELLKFHTHPDGVAGRGSTTSHPPSSGSPGSLGGDTNPYQDFLLQSDYIEPIEERTGVEINYRTFAVDTFGVWEYGQYSDEEIAVLDPELYEFMLEGQAASEAFLNMEMELNTSPELTADLNIVDLKRIADDSISASEDNNLISLVAMMHTHQQTDIDAWRDLLISMLVRGELPSDHEEQLLSGTEFETLPALRMQKHQYNDHIDKMFDEYLQQWESWKSRTEAGESVHDLMSDGTYDELISSYANRGIEVSYTPFTN